MIAMPMRESKCSDCYFDIIIIDQNLSCHSIILFKEMHMKAIHFCQVIYITLYSICFCVWCVHWSILVASALVGKKELCVLTTGTLHSELPRTLDGQWEFHCLFLIMGCLQIHYGDIECLPCDCSVQLVPPKPFVPQIKIDSVWPHHVDFSDLSIHCVYCQVCEMRHSESIALLLIFLNQRT